MKNKRAACLILWVFSFNVMALSHVELKEGINRLDLNHDGVLDYVTVAQFDNNTSHPNLGLTFFINRPEGGLSIMPIVGSDLFTWFDYRLSAASDFLVLDNRLFREGETFYLVTAKKKGENVFDPSHAELTFYRFNESQDDPGVPLYGWLPVKSLVTEDIYQSASQAYQEIVPGLVLEGSPHSR